MAFKKDVPAKEKDERPLSKTQWAAL